MRELFKGFRKVYKEEKQLCYSMASVTEAAPWTMTATQGAAPETSGDLGKIVVRSFDEFKACLDQSNQQHPVTTNYAELVLHSPKYESEPATGTGEGGILLFPDVMIQYNGGAASMPWQKAVGVIRQAKGNIPYNTSFPRTFVVRRQNARRADEYVRQLLNACDRQKE